MSNEENKADPGLTDSEKTQTPESSALSALFPRKFDGLSKQKSGSFFERLLGKKASQTSVQQTSATEANSEGIFGTIHEYSIFDLGTVIAEASSEFSSDAPVTASTTEPTGSTVAPGNSQKSLHSNLESADAASQQKQHPASSVSLPLSQQASSSAPASTPQASPTTIPLASQANPATGGSVSTASAAPAISAAASLATRVNSTAVTSTSASTVPLVSASTVPLASAPTAPLAAPSTAASAVASASTLPNLEAPVVGDFGGVAEHASVAKSRFTQIEQAPIEPNYLTDDEAKQWISQIPGLSTIPKAAQQQVYEYFLERLKELHTQVAQDVQSSKTIKDAQALMEKIRDKRFYDQPECDKLVDTFKGQDFFDAQAARGYLSHEKSWLNQYSQLKQTDWEAKNGLLPTHEPVRQSSTTPVPPTAPPTGQASAQAQGAQKRNYLNLAGFSPAELVTLQQYAEKVPVADAHLQQNLAYHKALRDQAYQAQQAQQAQLAGQAGTPTAGMATKSRPTQSQLSPDVINQLTQQYPVEKLVQWEQMGFEDEDFVELAARTEQLQAQGAAPASLSMQQVCGYKDQTELDLTPQQLQSLAQRPNFNKLGSEFVVTPTAQSVVAWTHMLCEQVADQEYLKKLETVLSQVQDKVGSYISIIAPLGDYVEALGLDAGLWFDNSEGELKVSNLDQLKTWLNKLQTNKGLKKIIEAMGKMMAAKAKEEIIKVSYQSTSTIQSERLPEEIVGIRMTKDLSWVLPSELVHLGDPDSEVIFDLKYLDEALLGFKLEGNEQISVEEEGEEVKTSPESRGPVILCVDTSGSMSGEPETVAKAVALYTSNQCRKEKRNCYLINFSTRISTLDLSGMKGLSELMNFLSMSFNGGTDVAPALHEALRVLRTDGYEKADVLVVSDFVMGSLDYSLTNPMSAQRKQGTTFNSLVVMNGAQSAFESQRNSVLANFDRAWAYDPNNNDIAELIKADIAKPKGNEDEPSDTQSNKTKVKKVTHKSVKK